MDGFMIQEFLWMLRYWKRELSPTRSLKSWQDNLGDWNRFWKSYRQYQELSSEKENVSLTNLYPCLGDATAETYIEPTYFYQDCWAFEKIVQQNPSNHIDIGSHHKYVALLSKVVPVTMVDIRPLSLPLESLNFKEGSILNLPFDDNSIESLSSLCVVEHIGLGRYGDPLDSSGSEKAMLEIQRILKSGGYCYFSVPILGNTNTVFFNAHRSFSEEYIENCFSLCKVIDKMYIYENSLQKNREDDKFGIGLYQFQKL
jgi:SAM-dependent methyltransferase